jgi:hypothetical protein
LKEKGKKVLPFLFPGANVASGGYSAKLLSNYLHKKNKKDAFSARSKD